MTQREIAEQLNISPATLSLVLNNKPGISTTLRQQVLNDLVTAGYSDLIKDPAITLDSKNIAFVLFRKNGKIVDQLPFSTFAQSLGYNMILSFFDLKDDVSQQIENLKNLSCDGAIIFATEMEEKDIQYFSSLPYPHVFMDSFFEKHDIDCVATNSILGAYQAINLLTSLGHKRIGYLKSAERTDTLKEREEGFANACQQLGVEFCNNWHFALPFISELAENQLKEQLTNMARHLKNMPTAFVSDDDIIAVGAIRAFQSSGFSIPEEISIIGFANRPIAEYSSPALTSIEVKDGFGIAALKQLLRRIEEKKSGTKDNISIKMRIGTQLVIRDSTRKKINHFKKSSAV